MDPGPKPLSSSGERHVFGVQSTLPQPFVSALKDASVVVKEEVVEPARVEQLRSSPLRFLVKPCKTAFLCPELPRLDLTRGGGNDHGEARFALEEDLASVVVLTEICVKKARLRTSP